MQFFSPFENLCIDIANHYGLDKELFETRIDWVKANKHQLEALAATAETKPLYQKAVMALRAAQRGEAVGHPIAFDAVCSGMQIMSAITGCYAGAHATGLIDPNRRMDAYSVVTQVMNQQPGIVVQVPRKKAKNAVMTSLYASKAQPKKIFGVDTPELSAFYRAMEIVAPGAWELLKDLLAAWNPTAYFHSWKLPDGFDARVKVMQSKEIRIEVDELNHATFTYEFEVNEPAPTGLSLVANVVHSIDAYVLNSMQRRCNYNPAVVKDANGILQMSLGSYAHALVNGDTTEMFDYYLEQYQRSGMVDVCILPHLTLTNVMYLTKEHREKLFRITNDQLQHKPFPIITVHDAYASLAGNCNALRWHYKEIMADLADSNILDDILSQLYGRKGSFGKLMPNLGDLIRLSNYGLS